MKYTAREKHANIISDFLIFLNKVTDKFVLKGGTALAKCYNLDRFEDIDLDSEKGNITSIVKNYCKSKNFTYCEKKNTSYGQRFMIDYKVDRQLLKVEVRLNEKINKDDVCKINGIIVYKINRLTLMKLQAYDSRDKIRDMYDIAFIINNYWDSLNEVIWKIIALSFENKGLEHFDYLIKQQKDDLIDTKNFLEKTLIAFNKVEEFSRK